MATIEPNKIYTSEEQADLLDVQERVLWSLLKKGDLRGVKIGRVWRISGSSLLDYVSHPPGNAVWNRAQEPEKT